MQYVVYILQYLKLKERVENTNSLHILDCIKDIGIYKHI